MPAWLGEQLKRARDRSLRRAAVNIVLGTRMRDYLTARGLDASRMRVVPNWADVEHVTPRAPEESLIRQELGLSGRFVVAYSGNLGRAHEFGAIIGAMQRLPDVRFVFTGGGAQWKSVQSAAPANAEFRPYVPRQELAASLSSVDAHLVSLRPALEGLIVPSKFYGIVAVGRPVIFIGARDGELARVIETCHCGLVVDAGDTEGLVRAIETLSGDRDAARAMGERGRELYLHRFAPKHAFAAWERVLEEAGA